MKVFSTLLLAALLLNLSTAGADEPGTAFSYQGELNQLGVPASGSFDFRFDLFNVLAGGEPIEAAVELEDVAVAGGVFSVELDFGPASYAVEQLWLEIAIRDGASNGPYTVLTPRQAVLPTPVAMQAKSALTVPDGSITAAQIDSDSVQRRVSGSCEVGEVVRAINADGTVVCESETLCTISACRPLTSTATLACGEMLATVACYEPRYERDTPCITRTTKASCRSKDGVIDPCTPGSGDCQCTWDAFVPNPFTQVDECPGSNENEPNSAACTSGNWCEPIACTDRITQSQCRPEDCGLNVACLCQWDAVNIVGQVDQCPGVNEDDPCPNQIPNEPAFCTDLPGGNPL